MEERGYIEIRIEGVVDNHPLTPFDVDIADIKEMIVDIETFLYPSKMEKSARPTISYRLEEGSAKHKFFLPVAMASMFSGLIGEISARNSIDFLDGKRALVVEKLQRKAKEENWDFTISTSSLDNAKLKITPATNFCYSVSKFVDTEFYLYGEIYQEGGINPNLHITTKEFGRLTVTATKEQLVEGDNKLYKIYGMKVAGKKSLIDKKMYDLRLIKYIEYDPVFDRTKLNSLIKKAKPNLSMITDVDAWLSELRGGRDHG